MVKPAQTKTLLFLFFISSQCISCQEIFKQDSTATPHVEIHRFDKQLYQWLSKDNQPLPSDFKIEYKDFLNLYSNFVIETGNIYAADFEEKLKMYFSNPSLQSLYRDAQQMYDSVPDIEKDLGKVFDELAFYFPDKKQPAVYMHVSGLNQSVIVGENILSLSVDKYLGKDYPLYKTYYDEYQRKNMIRERIVPDYLKAWLYSEFELGPENRLLDNLIYQGKILYAIQAVIPDIPEYLLLGFSQQELDLCLKNEKSIWHHILENKHLYANDYLIVSKYMNEAPRSAFFADGYPAQVGAFVGWRIVSNYMLKNKKITLPDLMKNMDYQQIMSKSKYKF